MRRRRGTIVVLGARRPSFRQRMLPFLARTERLDRWFKRTIVGLTVLAIVATVAMTEVGRYTAGTAAGWGRIAALRLIGMPRTREEVEPLVRACRARSIERTRDSLVNFYRNTEPKYRRLFRAVGMDPDYALIASGMATEAFVLSPGVFSGADNGRSYRLLPGRRSVWIRGIILKNGPFGLFLVPDKPEVRATTAEAGGLIDEESAQTTNSWGLRGPEPDPGAEVRGIVVGDSFMQGMLIGDNDTPPLCLERTLRDLWKVKVSVLNTGHLGYAPEQYFATLKEYGARFKPHFVVISVCPNDLGHGDFESGYGDEWEEARFWLAETFQWCRSRGVAYLVVTVPWEPSVSNSRKLGLYKRPVFDLIEGTSAVYCDPADQFVDEHLRLIQKGEPGGGMSPLYNRRVGDGHFSPAGARVWARVVARRLALLMKRPAGKVGVGDGGLPGEDR